MIHTECMQSTYVPRTSPCHSRLQLLICAEAGVGVACSDQLVHVLLVQGGALRLAVGAMRAPNIRACVYVRVLVRVCV
jgi:hypothetical protein